MKQNKHKMQSSPKQRQLIAIACGQLGIDKAEKEALLMTRFGHASTTQITYAQAEELIDDLANRGFQLSPKKRPNLRRKNPLPGGQKRRSAKIVGLASPAEHSKIDVLAGLIKWHVEGGMKKWMLKRFQIDEVITADQALKVIEGLKGLFQNQMKKEHGKYWMLQDYNDSAINNFIAEHQPNNF